MFLFGKKEESVVRCTNSNNHGMSVGNTGKWFSSKACKGLRRMDNEKYDTRLARWKRSL